MNCVAYSKTLKNADVYKVPASLLTSSSLVFKDYWDHCQSLLGSALLEQFKGSTPEKLLTSYMK